MRPSLLFALVVSLSTTPLLAQEPAPAPTTSTATTAVAVQRDPSYSAGLKALDESRWADAVADFDKSAATAPTASASALYWKAYSLEKLGRKDEATATCTQLRTSHGDSSWNRECSMLKAQTAIQNIKIKRLNGTNSNDDFNFDIDVSADLAAAAASLEESQKYMIKTNNNGGPKPNIIFMEDGHSHSHQPATEDDIKILALNGLLQQDPAKALPLLRSIIESDKPIEVRKQALFVLGRSRQPEAQAYLLEVARSAKDPVLQRDAVQSLWMSHPKDAGPTLVQIYRTSADAKVKQAAINGLFLAHDAPSLVDLARSEKDLNLKRDIVAQLALMKDPAATDYMLELLK